jgi:hypothetical protein
MSANSNTRERSRAIILVISSKWSSVRVQWHFEACNAPTPHNLETLWEAHRPCKCGTAGPLMASAGTAAAHAVAVIEPRPRTFSATEYALVRLPDSHVYALWP